MQNEGTRHTTNSKRNCNYYFAGKFIKYCMEITKVALFSVSSKSGVQINAGFAFQIRYQLYGVFLTDSVSVVAIKSMKFFGIGFTNFQLKTPYMLEGLVGIYIAQQRNDREKKTRRYESTKNKTQIKFSVEMYPFNYDWLFDDLNIA